MAANSPLKPARENPLSNFSSYTYNISLYMLSPDSYNEYASGGTLDSSKWKLICRSGGINNNKTRADGFTLDYYIDNLQIVTQVSGKETGAATNSFKFSFQVFEPYGFKFPTQLVQAASKLQQETALKRAGTVDETIVALQSQFLLVVRFYGYDSKGELINPSSYPQGDVAKTEQDAVFERSWPITIHGFKFKLDNKTTVYDIQAVGIGEQAAYGRTTGLAKETFEIKGKTVGEILIGSTSDSTKGNIVGLAEQLNNIQQKQKELKQLEVPDTYTITFAPNSGIDTATLVDLSDAGLEHAPAKSVKSSSSVNVRTAEKAPVIDKLTKPMTVTEEPIISVIDRVISQSSFLTNALGVKDKESKQALQSDKDYDVNSNASSTPLAWYNVNPIVKLGKFDNLRKRYAYDINYVIQRYEIPYIRGVGIGKKSQYPGPYKRYQYYYMGDTQNAKEIIGYEQDYNLLFYNLIAQSSQAPVTNSDDSAQAEATSGNTSTISKGNGVLAKTVGAFKTFLYGPADQLKARITILGDPDYLMTNTNRGLDAAIKKYYGEDGYSINPNTSQVFIEVDFRDAEDYDTASGLLPPSNDGDIMFWKYPPSLAKQIQGIAYNVWQVTSNFKSGKFTQELKVSLPPFKEDPKEPATGIGNMNSASLAPNGTNSATAIPSGGTTNLDSSGRMTAASDPRTVANSTNTVAPTTTKSATPVTTPTATPAANVVASDDGNK